MGEDFTWPSPNHTMQGPILRDIPVVWVYTMQIIEIKAGKVRLGNNNCMLIFDLAQYFSRDLRTLFINLKPRNKELRQLPINSITIVELFDNIIDFWKYIHKLNNSYKKTLLKFMNSFDAKIDTKKKAGMISEKK